MLPPFKFESCRPRIFLRLKNKRADQNQAQYGGLFCESQSSIQIVAWGWYDKQMEITIFFAKLWGSFFLIFGLLSLITRQLGKTIELTDNKAFVISTGYVSLLMGLVTVILHNVWAWDWPIVITILGWSTMIKGISKIGFPELIHKQAQRFQKHQWISALFMLILGGWLLWMSF